MPRRPTTPPEIIRFAQEMVAELKATPRSLLSKGKLNILAAIHRAEKRIGVMRERHEAAKTDDDRVRCARRLQEEEDELLNIARWDPNETGRWLLPPKSAAQKKRDRKTENEMIRGLPETIRMVKALRSKDSPA